MGICRDTFGRLSYTMSIPISPKYSRVFSVTRGDNRIRKHEPYYITDTYLTYDGVEGWWDLSEFDSFIQAVRFLKANADKLI